MPIILAHTLTHSHTRHSTVSILGSTQRVSQIPTQPRIRACFHLVTGDDEFEFAPDSAEHPAGQPITSCPDHVVASPPPAPPSNTSSQPSNTSPPPRHHLTTTSFAAASATLQHLATTLQHVVCARRRMERAVKAMAVFSATFQQHLWRERVCGETFLSAKVANVSRVYASRSAF